MNTERIPVDPASPDPEVIARAAATIREGGLVAFPTETVYGLGANALDQAAVRSIFTAKGRPASNPLIVHVAEPEEVRNVAASWPETANRLASRFWPGPLTLVLPKLARVSAEVTANGPTVAVRCPDHPVARALIAAAQVPVAAPSANRSTEVSPTKAEHVLKGLRGRINMILDGGSCLGGIESTVVDVTGERVRLLRPGLITVPMLEEVIGLVDVVQAADGIARSPGHMAKHYSPRTPVRLVEARTLSVELQKAQGAGINCGLLELPDDPRRAAAVLYEALHLLDDQHFDLILIATPPDTADWVALRDRLFRASG